jgi:hypothetical protein
MYFHGTSSIAPTFCELRRIGKPKGAGGQFPENTRWTDLVKISSNVNPLRGFDAIPIAL